MNTYESDSLLSQYLFFHYGKASEILPWGFGPSEALDYAVRCVSQCFPIGKTVPARRGLDIGCATGRSSFEMARHCGEVVGIDYSASFIEAADTIRTAGSLPYRFAIEGTRSLKLTATRPERIDPATVRFAVGDAHEIDPALGTFDWILGANLLCRLHHPRRFLERLPSLLNPGGILVLNSPFTWLEDYTAPGEWIGAREESGTSAEVLRQMLEPDFILEEEKAMPFLIAETGRKYQYTVAHSMRLRRRE